DQDSRQVPCRRPPLVCFRITGPSGAQFFRAFGTQRWRDAMKRKRFTEEQIAFALRQAESGISIEESCRKMGVSEPTFYRWKKQFVGMGVTEIRRLKQLAEEKGKLKKIVADLTLDKTMLQDVLRRKWLGTPFGATAQI